MSQAERGTGARQVPHSRPPGRGGGTSALSDLRLLGDFKSIIDFDAKVPHGRLQLGVPQEQLHGTQVFGASVDQRRLGPTHRVRAIVCAIQSEFIDPVPEDPSILPSAQMGDS